MDKQKCQTGIRHWRQRHHQQRQTPPQRRQSSPQQGQPPPPQQQHVRNSHHCFGLAVVTLVGGAQKVGDLWRHAGGWLELVAFGDEPDVLQWLPVASVVLCNDVQKRELEDIALRKLHRKRTPTSRAAPDQPEPGGLGSVLLT